MRRLGLHDARCCCLARAGPFPGSFRVLSGAGLGGEERGGTGYGGYGTGVVGHLQRIEGRAFDSKQRPHLPTNTPGSNVGGVGGQGGSGAGKWALESLGGD